MGFPALFLPDAVALAFSPGNGRETPSLTKADEFCFCTISFEPLPCSGRKAFQIPLSVAQ